VVFASNIFGDATLYRLDAPRQREFQDHLVAAGFRPILMDVRGMGGSDRRVEDVNLDARTRDVEAVTGRLGLSRFALCGFDNGAVTAIAYAVKHPDKVTHLLLFMPWRSWGQKFTAVVSTQAISAMSPQNEEEWQVWAKVAGSIATRFEDIGAANKMAAAIHQASSAAQRAIYMRATQEIDISNILPLIQTPTLVLHHP
jgi:pimeloyl-ACP methyl ester carboxylesterase